MLDFYVLSSSRGTSYKRGGIDEAVVAQQSAWKQSEAAESPDSSHVPKILPFSSPESIISRQKLNSESAAEFLARDCSGAAQLAD